MLSSGAIYPVYQLMKDQGIKIDWEDFISVVKTYYSKGGNLYSMPFNSSTPILYYNKTAFEKAGLNPQAPPKTFEEIEKCAKAVRVQRSRQNRLHRILALLDPHGEYAHLERSALCQQQ